MSLVSSEREAKWIWFDGNTWQSYDDDTNYQIEHAYLNNKEFVCLDRGSRFGQHPNVYRVYFNYSTNSPLFNQINVITNENIQIRRTTQSIKSPHYKSQQHGNNCTIK